MNPEQLLRALEPRERAIVEGRFGIGREPQTLQELGVEFCVTRERIRQIEARALRRLRTHSLQAIRRDIDSNYEYLWSRCARGMDVIRVDALDVATRELSGADRLFVELAYGSLKKWFASTASRCDGFWVRKGYTNAQLAEWRTRTRLAVASMPLPRPVPDLLSEAGLPASAERVLLALVPELKCYVGYAALSNFGKRLCRAVHLHRLMVPLYDCGPITPSRLHQLYQQSFPQDSCTYRDLDIVLARHPHLFLNLYDDGWIAILCDVAAPEVLTQPMDALALTLGESEVVEADEGVDTVAATLKNILQSFGPLGFGELRDRFTRFPSARGARTSVGPIVITRPTDFIRLAPGIYGLPQHASAPLRVVDVHSVLLNRRQCMLYCNARWAGEPTDLFPWWNSTAELAWARWARRQEDDALLQSLLAVVNVRDWPLGDEAERTEWEQLQRLHARYAFQASAVPDLLETVPTMRDIARVAVSASVKGTTSWISANRAIGARVDDAHVASVLAVLIAAKIILPAEHWQRQHAFNGMHEDAVAGLLRIASRKAAHEFEPAALEQLRRMTNEDIPLGWVPSHQLTQLLMRLGAPRTQDEQHGETEDGEVYLAEALAELRNQRRERGVG